MSDEQEDAGFPAMIRAELPGYLLLRDPDRVAEGRREWLLSMVRDRETGVFYGDWPELLAELEAYVAHGKLPEPPPLEPGKITPIRGGKE